VQDSFKSYFGTNFGMRFEKQKHGTLFLAGKWFSFCLMLGFFMAVFYLLVFGHGLLQQNLLLFGMAIAALVVVNVVFPRALGLVRKNELSNGMEQGSRDFAEKFSHAIGAIALSITYVLGVGTVFVLSRLFGKRFMEIRQKEKESYWVEKKESGKSEEMF